MAGEPAGTWFGIAFCRSLYIVYNRVLTSLVFVQSKGDNPRLILQHASRMSFASACTAV